MNRDELWLRYVEGESLSQDESETLAEALQSDRTFARQCLDDQTMIGLMREAQRASTDQDGDTMVRSVLERLRADDNEDSFVRGVMDKLPPENRSVTPVKRRRRSSTTARRAARRHHKAKGPGHGPGIWAWVSMAAVVAMGVFLFVNHGAPQVNWVVASLDGQSTQGGRPLQVNAKVFPGLPLSSQSGLVLKGGGSTVALGAGAEVVLLSSRSGDTWLLRRGDVTCVVAKQPSGKQFKVQTVHATSRVLGTRFRVRHTGETTRLEVEEGRVAFDDVVSAQTSILTAGESIESTPPKDKVSPLSSSAPVATATGLPAGAIARWDFAASGLMNLGSAPFAGFKPAKGVVLDDRGLVLNGMVPMVSTEPAAFLSERAQRSKALTVVLRIDPDPTFADFDTKKIGPARIITVSGTSHERNLTIGQGEMRMSHPGYSFRVRRNRGSENGLPALASPGASKSGVDTLVMVMTVDGTSVYLNGQKVADDKKAVNFSDWDPSYRLVLGAEINPDDRKGIRGWQGIIKHLAFYDRAITPTEIKNIK